MQPIIYDVAVSADGFIAGPSADISRFAHHGPVVDDYMARLATYACAIMGRATYEFGYGFGLKPGANPYPHMTCVVFSRTLTLPAETEVEIVRDAPAARIDHLKRTSPGPIYLCGGGQFAGWLLSQGLIDRLRLKRAPIFLGDGTPLFGDRAEPVDATVGTSKLYDGGYLFQEFDLTDECRT